MSTTRSVEVWATRSATPLAAPRFARIDWGDGHETVEVVALLVEEHVSTIRNGGGRDYRVDYDQPLETRVTHGWLNRSLGQVEPLDPDGNPAFVGFTDEPPTA